jgi:hypothetical protein
MFEVGRTAHYQIDAPNQVNGFGIVGFMIDHLDVEPLVKRSQLCGKLHRARPTQACFGTEQLPIQVGRLQFTAVGDYYSSDPRQRQRQRGRSP